MTVLVRALLIRFMDRFLEHEQTIALVDCPAFPRPVFLTDAGKKEFHVRAGTTRLLDVDQAASYIGQHWGTASRHAPPAQFAAGTAMTAPT